MGGFVRVFSSRNGSGNININNQIIFSSPVILYSYENNSYKAMPNKRGFSFTFTEDHHPASADGDHEGVALAVAGLDPVKEYTVNFTLRANRAADCTYSGGKSNGVGFTQSFDNVKNRDTKIFGITDNADNDIYKCMRFDNVILKAGTMGGVDFTNYIPITSVSTTPAEYSLTIKRGCNGMALLCFELSYPNTATSQNPMIYYFENFSIIDTEMAISGSEPLSMYCYSENNAHINGYMNISNLNIAEDGEEGPKYQVIKVNASGKCANGTTTIYMRYGSTQSPTYVTLGVITGEEDFNVTYTLGISSLYAINLGIVATYNPGIYDNSGTYIPVAGVYSDDLIDITCTATGSDSVLFQNTYKNPSGNLAGSAVSEEVARQIATDVGIILNDYGQGIATYTTFEDVATVILRAGSMNYTLYRNGSTGSVSNPTYPVITDNVIGG